MASINVPSSLKPIIPYIKRAEELDKESNILDSKTVAYFCRLYAIDFALKLRNQNNKDEVSSLVKQILLIQEKDRITLGENSSSELGKRICESFAFSVFNQADEEDRSGKSNKLTAKLFYTAITYFDILEQFGDLDDEIIEKRKYCKWKATDIIKSIKEGLVPKPGGPGEDTLLSNSSLHTPNSLPRDTINLNVITLSGANFSIQISAYDTILNLKEKINLSQNIPIAQQLIKLQGVHSWLENDKSISHYQIVDNAIIELVETEININKIAPHPPQINQNNSIEKDQFLFTNSAPSAPSAPTPNIFLPTVIGSATVAPEIIIHDCVELSAFAASALKVMI